MTAMTICAPDVEHWELSGLAEKIRNEVAAAESHARNAVTSALRAGELLNQAKSYVQHGQWEAWLSANSLLSCRTAQAYMRLARNIELLPAVEAQRVADLPLREAIRAIATDPVAPTRIKTSSPIRLIHRDSRERASKSIESIIKALKKSKTALSKSSGLEAYEVAKLKSQLQAALAQVESLEQESARDENTVVEVVA